MIELVYFMMCFKVCVRAKVSFFRAQELDKKKKKKIIQEEEAKKHLILAKKYTKFF
jgi:aminoglycoside phosphotransferase family enzyme